MFKKIVSIITVFILITALGSFVLAEDTETSTSTESSQTQTSTQEDQQTAQTGDQQSVDQELGLNDYIDSLEVDNVTKVALKRTLTDYEENVSVPVIKSVVDSYLKQDVSDNTSQETPGETTDIELGRILTTLNNIQLSVEQGVSTDKVAEMIDSTQSVENRNQVMSQLTLELKKISQVDDNGEYTTQFSEEMMDKITDGELKISDLKQAASQFRREARERKREEMKEKVQNKIEENSNTKHDKITSKDKDNDDHEKNKNKNQKKYHEDHSKDKSHNNGKKEEHKEEHEKD